MSSYEYMVEWMRDLHRSDRGAALVEYALLLTFIAIVCLTAVAFMGEQLSESFDATGTSVGMVN